MLDDRHYMREPSFTSGQGFMPRRSATMLILVVNGIAFLLQALLERFPSVDVNAHFALSLDGLKSGFLWQLITFQLMHGGLIHLLLNGWVIYMFGREVEESLGQKNFLTLYISSGVCGGLLQCLSELIPGQISGPVVGASAGAFGLTAAFALLYPDRILLLFFIIPMRARYLLVLSAMLSVYGIISRGDNIAHAAHLGGMLAGVFFIRYAIHWKFPEMPRPALRKPPLVTVKAHPKADYAGLKKVVPIELSPEEFVSREVDPILDKISTHGIHSLTDRERKILQLARDKIDRK